MSIRWFRLLKCRKNGGASELEDDVRIQWLVNLERKEVAAVRMIYDEQNSGCGNLYCAGLR